MDGENTPLAFCPLLWAAHGGRLDEKGRPSVRHGDAGARGNCTQPYDCYQCTLMQEEISRHPTNEVHWVCPDCIQRLRNLKRSGQLHVKLPGFFTEGFCQAPGCQRPKLNQEEGDQARHSVFLQLVLGKLEEG